MTGKLNQDLQEKDAIHAKTQQGTQPVNDKFHSEPVELKITLVGKIKILENANKRQ